MKNTGLILFIATLAVPFTSAGWDYQPNRVVEYTTTCTKDSLDIMLTLDSSFKGVVFAKDYPDVCQSNGTSDSVVLLTLPTRGCGVRSDPDSSTGLLHPSAKLLSVQLIVQMDGRLRQAADLEVSVRCKLQDEIDQQQQAWMENKDKMMASKRTGRTERFASVSGWLELYGATGSDHAEVGRNATMRVSVRTGDAGKTNKFKNSRRIRGARVADCYASDGAPGEITQLLLDRRGCPIDPLILPGLEPEITETQQQDGESAWSFVTNFAAFKFPDRQRITIRCDVQLCETECRKLDCDLDDFPEIDYVDRIEVYNSLFVEAPDIDNDKDDRENDVVVVPQRIRQEPMPMITKSQKRRQQAGTFCLSPQKLALSFCIMGLIFLVAIIVALCSWFMRSRQDKQQTQRRYSNVYACSRSALSLGGSSTKLLVNDNTSWPYGRVF